jgi:hypothetical protein
VSDAVCPACIATGALIVAGAGWTGWLTAMVVKDVREERRAS